MLYVLIIPRPPNGASQCHHAYRPWPACGCPREVLRCERNPSDVGGKASRPIGPLIVVWT